MSIHAPSDLAKDASRPRRNAAADQPLSMAERVRLERHGGRIFVILTRRYERLFGLSDEEALYLSAILAAEAGRAA
jgi:hypothetical protein